MGAALNCKRTGKCGSKQVKKVASGMSEEQLRDFAGTKRKDLPEHVEKALNWNNRTPAGEIVEHIRGMPDQGHVQSGRVHVQKKIGCWWVSSGGGVMFHKTPEAAAKNIKRQLGWVEKEEKEEREGAVQKAFDPSREPKGPLYISRFKGSPGEIGMKLDTPPGSRGEIHRVQIGGGKGETVGYMGVVYHQRKTTPTFSATTAGARERMGEAGVNQLKAHLKYLHQKAFPTEMQVTPMPSRAERQQGHHQHRQRMSSEARARREGRLKKAVALAYLATLNIRLHELKKANRPGGPLQQRPLVGPMVQGPMHPDAAVKQGGLPSIASLQQHAQHTTFRGYEQRHATGQPTFMHSAGADAPIQGRTGIQHIIRLNPGVGPGAGNETPNVGRYAVKHAGGWHRFSAPHGDMQAMSRDTKVPIRVVAK